MYIQNTIDKLHQPHPMPREAAEALAAQCHKDEEDGWTYSVIPHLQDDGTEALFQVDVRDESGFFLGTL